MELVSLKVAAERLRFLPSSNLEKSWGSNFHWCLMMSKLYVFYEDKKVGVLIKDDELIYSFKYDEHWLKNPNNFPLSFALPLTNEVFGNKSTLSFFENLLPEGNVLDALAGSEALQDPFDFLKQFGQDCAGAINLSSKENPPPLLSPQEKVEINLREINQAIDKNHSVAKVIAGHDPGYLSLAGAQDKFAAILESEKLFLPKGGAPTTHIVKVPINRNGVKESVYNEYFCMQLAGAIGLEVPHTVVLNINPHPIFIIERYDRETKDSITHRLHQQDFCQAQGIVSASKYETRGGPSLKMNYELIKKHVYAQKKKDNLFSFIDWVCFNLLIGNNDSHSKNISFLFRKKKVELAPFYDLLCTSIYPSLKREFSFMIGDRNDFSRIGKNQFEIAEDQMEIKRGTMSERMQLIHNEIMNKKASIVKQVNDECPNNKIVNRISSLIEDRSRSLKQQGIKL